MQRRQFFVTLAAPIALIPLVRVLGACGDPSVQRGQTGDLDDSSDEEGGDDGSAFATLNVGAGVTVGADHGHSVSIAGGDIENSTAAKTYTLGGPHEHTFEVTVADFDTLRACGQVTVTASGSGHTHSVTLFAC